LPAAVESPVGQLLLCFISHVVGKDNGDGYVGEQSTASFDLSPAQITPRDSLLPISLSIS